MATEVGDTPRPRRRKKRKTTAPFHASDGKRHVVFRTRVVRPTDFTTDVGPQKTAILLRVHPLLYEKLCVLAKTGLYGFYAEDVAERLMAEQLRWILRQP